MGREGGERPREGEEAREVGGMERKEEGGEWEEE